MVGILTAIGEVHYHILLLFSSIGAESLGAISGGSKTNKTNIVVLEKAFKLPAPIETLSNYCANFSSKSCLPCRYLSCNAL
jgi:hypothetical protein